MSNLKVIEPTLISMEHEYTSEYSDAITKVNFLIGDISWKMEYNHKDDKLDVNKYSDNSAYESFLKTMAAINVEVNINCHNELIKSEFAIYKEHYNAQKKEEAAKKEIEKQEYMNVLKEQLLTIFPNYEITVNYENSFTLNYHGIRLSACRMEHRVSRMRCYEYKWEIDTREWCMDSFGKRFLVRGHKRSNKDIEKLKTEINSYFSYKYNELLAKKKNNDFVEAFDKSMAEKGWMPAGEKKYFEKYKDFINTSSNGTLYSKDNMIISISHKDKPTIIKIIKAVNIPIEDIDTLID